MRGILHIASARAPFRRAGLEWSTKAAQPVDIRKLDGARLLALISDPVLTVQIEDEAGAVKPFPIVPASVTANDLQGMIDTLASQMPAAEAEGTAERVISAERHDAVLQEVADLLKEVERQADVIGGLEANRDQADAFAGAIRQALGVDETDIDLVATVASLRARVAALETKLSQAEIDAGRIIGERDQRIAELETAASKKAAKPAPAKPKADAS
ncbi:hypothetical protein ACPVPU_07290 [Sphingomonas sp. CJ99]